MALIKLSLRQSTACLRCVRQPRSAVSSLNRSPLRVFSTSSSTREEVLPTTSTTTTTTPPQPFPVAENAPADAQPHPASPARNDFMKRWGPLNPNFVESKRDERRLIRREGIQPIGSRRRRAALRRSAMRKTPEIPFEQLPYQCFQEARKFLATDREEKLAAIRTQTLRLGNLMAQDSTISGGEEAKERRIRSMRNHINELVILADINDPMVKKTFEDGLGKCF